MRWTARELEVIRAIQACPSYTKAAERLGVTPGTVSTYAHQIARLVPGRGTPLRKILRMELPEPSEEP